MEKQKKQNQAIEYKNILSETGLSLKEQIKYFKNNPDISLGLILGGFIETPKPVIVNAVSGKSAVLNSSAILPLIKNQIIREELSTILGDPDMESDFFGVVIDTMLHDSDYFENLIDTGEIIYLNGKHDENEPNKVIPLLGKKTDIPNERARRNQAIDKIIQEADLLVEDSYINGIAGVDLLDDPIYAIAASVHKNDDFMESEKADALLLVSRLQHRLMRLRIAFCEYLALG